MNRPELLRKPLVGEKAALRAVSCIPVEGEPDYYRMEEAKHDGSLDWLGTDSRPIVLSFDGNHWNRSVGPEGEHVPNSGDRRLLENQFFGSNKVHNQHEYEEIKKRRPRGRW